VCGAADAHGEERGEIGVGGEGGYGGYEEGHVCLENGGAVGPGEEDGARLGGDGFLEGPG
jgi:hypothetical protein